MDYLAMLTAHTERKADCTLACMEVPIADAKGFGVVAVDEQLSVTQFIEKSPTPAPMPNDPHHALASMGIYVFSLNLLCEMLEADHRNPNSSHDFGKDILPQLIKTHHVSAYLFGGPAGRVSQDRYWRDVGTIDAFFEANMDLLQPRPPINLYQPNWPIRTYEPQVPPARMIPGPTGVEGQLLNSMLASGVVIEGGTVRHSILSANAYVGEGAEVEQSMLFEGVTVGAGARLQNCIVDKYVKIPPGTQIGHDRERDAQRFTVSERGVVVVPKKYQFED